MAPGTHSINPACGQGADLSENPHHPFSSDIDSNARTVPWDIGADQTERIIVVEPRPLSSLLQIGKLLTRGGLFESEINSWSEKSAQGM